MAPGFLQSTEDEYLLDPGACECVQERSMDRYLQLIKDLQ